MVLPLLEQVYGITRTKKLDLYVYERRIEKDFPEVEKLLSNMRQGYLSNQASAQAILDFLTKHFKTNDSIVTAIRLMIKKTI